MEVRSQRRRAGFGKRVSQDKRTMPMEEESLENSFPKAVAAAVKTHLSSWGFAVRQTDEQRIVCVESPLWQMQVTLSYTTANIALRLMSEAAKWRLEFIDVAQLTRRMFAEPIRESYEPVDLWNILGVLAQDLTEEDRYPRPVGSTTGMVRDLDRQMELLTTRCGRLLNGDIEPWQEVLDARQYLYGRKLQEGEKWNEYLDRLRETASAALRRGEYWKAANFYGQLRMVRGRMTLKDRYRYWQAHKHTFMLY